MSSLSTFTVYISPSSCTKNWKESTWQMLFEKAKGRALFKVELWDDTKNPGTGTERRMRVGVNPFNLYVMYMKSQDLVALRAAWHPSSKRVEDTTETVLPFWRDYPDKNGAKKAGAKIAALSEQNHPYGSDTWEKIEVSITHKTVQSKIKKERSISQDALMGSTAAQASFASYCFGPYSDALSWSRSRRKSGEGRQKTILAKSSGPT
ncbi:hypothetical protein K438DRAFT_1985229 [Mycena galopus ATCC 62051]|nr:hypothetical protein K438DRAFT_1985229 [Mycena galopus ATCC 62051]